MADLAPYADIEVLLLQVLADLGEVVTVLPGDFDATLKAGTAVIRVRRLGGTDNGVTDMARVDVDVHAATRAQAWTVAEQVRQRLVSGPRRVAGVGVMDRAVTEVAPQEVPPDSTAYRRVLTSYRVSSRRPHL